MIINGQKLLAAAPIKNMLTTKELAHGVSHGLAEAGYDIRLRQTVEFKNVLYPSGYKREVWIDGKFSRNGVFSLASAIEEFQMPTNLVGVVHDKSTWARQGLSVFNTVIEPGFHGGLTLELYFKAENELTLSAGCGIAQVLFSAISEEASYAGKYQGQSTEPVASVFV